MCLGESLPRWLRNFPEVASDAATMFFQVQQCDCTATTLRPPGDYNVLRIFHLAGVLSETLPAFSVFLQPFCQTCEILKAENWPAYLFLFVTTESLYLWDKKFWLYVKDRFSTLARKLSLCRVFRGLHLPPQWSLSEDLQANLIKKITFYKIAVDDLCCWCILLTLDMISFRQFWTTALFVSDLIDSICTFILF